MVNVLIFLRDIRKSRKLTMKQLGKMVGVSEAAIGYYETEKRTISYEMLLKLSEALDCSISDIVQGEKNPATKGDGNEEPDNSITRLITAVQQLTEQEAEFLLPQVMGIISGRETRKSKSANG